MEGEQAFAKLTAALQIAVKGAANPDEAANNFQNFLAKIASPETVRAFKKQGIDLRKELDNALANGVDPMEYLLVRINELAKDNKWITNDLFGDMQVQNFLKPMLQQLEEYSRIRDEILKADGVIDTDYDRVMDTIVERWKSFVIELGNANAVSGGLADVIKDGLIAATNLVRTFNQFAADHPELTDALVKTLATVLAIGVATRLLGYAWALTGGAAVNALKILWKFKPVGKMLTRLAGSVGRMGGTFMALKALATGALGAIAAAGAPVWAVVATIAGAALLIYKYWEPLGAFFGGLFGGLLEAGSDAASEIASLWGKAFTSIEGLVGKIAESFGADAAATIAAFRAVFDFSWVGEKLSALKASLGNFLSDLFTPVELTDDQLFDISQLGKKIGKRIGELVLFIPKELAKIAPALIDIGAQWATMLIDGFKANWA
ncbi:MAG: phage tail tape measure protein, partial [Cohaesibacter sp.]|nr:phage tail tape measure protein [Cohaesibacter sp.]